MQVSPASPLPLNSRQDTAGVNTGQGADGHAGPPASPLPLNSRQDTAGVNTGQGADGHAGLSREPPTPALFLLFVLGFLFS